MAEMPPADPNADPIDEAFAAYLRSCDEGSLDSREDFLAQYPAIADRLKELIDAADMIGNITMGRGAKPSSASGLVASVLTGSETIASYVPDAGESGDDPNATLPMAHRA